MRAAELVLAVLLGVAAPRLLPLTDCACTSCPKAIEGRECAQPEEPRCPCSDDEEAPAPAEECGCTHLEAPDTALEITALPARHAEAVQWLDAPATAAPGADRPAPETFDTGPPRIRTPIWLSVRCLRL